MRLDYINNMRNIYRQEKMRTYRRTVLFFLSLAVLAYLGMLVSIMVGTRDDGVSCQAAVAKYESSAVRVAVDASSTAGTPAADVRATQAAIPKYRPSVGMRHSYVPSASSMPQHTFQSTSSGITVHTTSSATVKNVGGSGSAGGSGGGTAVTSSSSAAFSASTSIMVLPTLARVSSRSLTAENTLAAEAEIIENTATERAAKPGIRRVYDDPFDPFLDPVGEGLWALLLFAAAYGVFMFCRKRQRV